MIKQISVFMENKSGRLNQLLKALAENDINITALSIADTGEYGITRLIVKDHEKAVAAIKDCGMTASETEVIALEVADKAGTLFEASNLLAENGVNVEYLYMATPVKENTALIIVKIENIGTAIDIIRHIDGITVIEL